MKIAFCFLTYNDIIRYDIWNIFFKNIDIKKYVVFIHNKFNIYNISNNYTFPFHIVKNKINTIRKEDISIVNATLRLFEETLNVIDGENITHFIFLTQSCIPLYSFDILYNIITKFDKSVISFIDFNKKERYFQLSNELKKYISYNQFIKQQPNMILIKDDVQLLLKNDFTNYFKNMECPDEHYFINILKYILKRNYIKKQINFCNTDLKKTQALEFKEINNFFIEKIRSFGFLFMRKVIKNSIIDTDYLLNNK
jgi:hypothetical protein